MRPPWMLHLAQATGMTCEWQPGLRPFCRIRAGGLELNRAGLTRNWEEPGIQLVVPRLTTRLVPIDVESEVRRLLFS